ncbi:MAG: FecR family protein [Beijerinckiaceae bacterium]|nr:FecR family protein [Beijerinckiaceae bacterium]
MALVQSCPPFSPDPRPSGRRARASLVALLVLLPSALPLPAFANDVIGKAETIENRVLGQQGEAPRPLAVPDPVHRNERVTTEDKAQARLRFKDETDLRLGPKASIKLDAFVYSGEKNAAMELSTGAMRFVSGNGPKGSYIIRTPVATVGLRGTTVEVSVINNRTYVSLHEGAAQVCTRSGRCMELTQACTYVSVDGRGVTLPQRLSSRLPVYSAQCTGDFCVVDRCTPQIKGQGGTVPPAARPPRATPPKAPPPRPQRPRRVVIEEEEIIDEPIYRRPSYPALVPVIPGLIIGPGFGRPSFPGSGGRYPGRVPQGPKGRMFQ